MLRLVYRSYGGENRKGRPGYYSKLTALASFLRAAQAQPAEILFVNDGPIPEERLDLMRAAGELVPLDRAGLRGSYYFSLRLVRSRDWSDDDLVYYSEDDYLHVPDAFRQLAAAVDQLPEADYFALYGHVPSSPLYPASEYEAWLPAGWQQRPERVVDGQGWTNVLSTTSTFGGRVSAFREDLRIFRQCMYPFRRRFLDHETCVVYQGYQPYAWSDLLRSATLRVDGSTWQRARAAAFVPFGVALNLRARRRPERRRLLYGATPNLATHLELGLLSPGTDWERCAADADAWLAARRAPALPVAE